MEMLVTCTFSQGSGRPQVLTVPSASDADVQVVRDAMNGDPDDVITIPARITDDGPVSDRLVRAGAIDSVETR